MSDDFSELMQLAADLESAPKNLAPHLAKAFHRTSNKVKKSARESVRKRNGLGHAANAIEYEMKGTSGATSELVSEIGYKEGTEAGNLGTMIEFGAPNAKKHILVPAKGGKKGKKRNVPVPGDIPRPLPPSNDLGNALLAHEDDFHHGIEEALDDAMREAKL